MVRESNGRLRDWVLVDGRTEVRAEPAWSPMKFEARQAEVALDRAEPPACARPSIEPRRPEDHPILTIEPPRSSNGERLLLTGIEAYILERVDSALRMRLAVVADVGDPPSTDGLDGGSSPAPYPAPSAPALPVEPQVRHP